MSASERQFLVEFAARETARARFEERLAQVRADLDARGVGIRVADRIEGQARDTWDATLEVARDNPGVVAGTIAALAIWLLRNPIIAAFDRMLGGDPEHEDQRS